MGDTYPVVTVECAQGCGATVVVAPLKWAGGSKRHELEHQVSRVRGTLVALRQLGWSGTNNRSYVRASCPACVAAGRNCRPFEHPVSEGLKDAFSSLRDLGVDAALRNFDMWAPLPPHWSDATFVRLGCSIDPRLPGGKLARPYRLVVWGDVATVIESLAASGLSAEVKSPREFTSGRRSVTVLVHGLAAEQE
jgi:hypothetical protein